MAEERQFLDPRELPSFRNSSQLPEEKIEVIIRDPKANIDYAPSWIPLGICFSIFFILLAVKVKLSPKPITPIGEAPKEVPRPEITVFHDPVSKLSTAPPEFVVPTKIGSFVAKEATKSRDMAEVKKSISSDELVSSMVTKIVTRVTSKDALKNPAVKEVVKEKEAAIQPIPAELLPLNELFMEPDRVKYEVRRAGDAKFSVLSIDLELIFDE